MEEKLKWSANENSYAVIANTSMQFLMERAGQRLVRSARVAISTARLKIAVGPGEGIRGQVQAP